ncbi:MAG: Arginine N-succinyltransferase subunit alpha, partial [Chlamydiae bacterium]|nr:Arginine N-succinyltransferase subunit alpha [Chlamydiota bacterium]
MRSMKIIRPIRVEDRESFEELAFQTSLGITSLPKDADQLFDKILQSQEAFDEKKHDPHHHIYIFVLEDLETNTLMGTCGIKAKTAVTEPLYCYRIENIDNTSSTRHVPKTLKILRAIKIRNGPSEVCGLYLSPEHRSENLGYLLSYSRFLFMACHPCRFDDKVIAEMRGYFDEKGENPFWNWVGRHFFDVDYDDAIDRQSRTTSFIPDILPKFPIYIDLLPHEVQRTIGKTHKNTEAALNLLLKIGFSLTHEVDIFDAGPKVWAPVKEIVPLANSRVDKVCSTSDSIPET